MMASTNAITAANTLLAPTSTTAKTNQKADTEKADTEMDLLSTASVGIISSVPAAPLKHIATTAKPMLFVVAMRAATCLVNITTIKSERTAKEALHNGCRSGD